MLAVTQPVQGLPSLLRVFQCPDLRDGHGTEFLPVRFSSTSRLPQLLFRPYLPHCHLFACTCFHRATASSRCYYDQEVLITDRKLIAYHYLKCVVQLNQGPLCILLLYCCIARVPAQQSVRVCAGAGQGNPSVLCDRLRFWVDILALFPFDYIIIEAAFPRCFVDETARYWSLLKILRLVRCLCVLRKCNSMLQA